MEVVVVQLEGVEVDMKVEVEEAVVVPLTLPHSWELKWVLEELLLMAEALELDQEKQLIFAFDEMA